VNRCCTRARAGCTATCARVHCGGDTGWCSAAIVTPRVLLFIVNGTVVAERYLVRLLPGDNTWRARAAVHGRGKTDRLRTRTGSTRQELRTRDCVNTLGKLVTQGRHTAVARACAAYRVAAGAIVRLRRCCSYVTVSFRFHTSRNVWLPILLVRHRFRPLFLLCATHTGLPFCSLPHYRRVHC